MRDGRLEAVRIGRQYRIGADALEAFTGRAVTPARRRATVEVSSIVQIDDADRALVDRVNTLVMSSAGGAAHDDEGLRCSPRRASPRRRSPACSGPCC